MEINKIKIKEFNKTKSSFFKKFNKIDTLFARLNRKKREDSNY